MKLSVDLSALFNAVSKMGVDRLVDISISSSSNQIQADFDTDLTSRRGVEIDIEDIEVQSGLFTWKGEHVLLFIPDHSYNFDDVVFGNSEGNKYHLTFCKTLDDMKAKGRFKRYFATNNTEGIFKIFNNSGKEAEVKLNVCKNCLMALNYKNYSQNRNLVFNQFNLTEFFQFYNTKFIQSSPSETEFIPGYPKDWEIISRKYRESKHYCCESCGVILNNYPHLLDVHHKNGVKQDCRAENLMALCKLCHSEQDLHEHYRVDDKDALIIIALRGR